ncbi:GNAT family N-acetyltransferase [Streptomyces ferrugineus]|uniref:GNAT family N-acetyltransferase n=1 Tax=Streptomyces ferrugineus TaxID=1413221 RepID=UPI001D13FEB8|nr:GNAT family N-acetyltransferase [Streptomyces ferrugineus]
MIDTQISIRPARTEEAHALAALHTRTRTAYYTAGGLPAQELAGAERISGYWQRAVDEGRAQVAAASGGRVVGFLMAGSPKFDDIAAASVRELQQIGVDPTGWGRGVGGLLHAAFVRRLRADGLTEGVVECWEANARAQAFYARQGWRPDGSRRPGPLGRDYVRLRLTIPC